MNYSVYGTVYNSVATVEVAIASVFRPEYETVIVDGGSTDGTYEKLLSIRKDYNLQVLRRKCSRGIGRDYALKHCADGSRTAYIDLDASYNINFHKLMAREEEKLLVCGDQCTFYINKEDAIRKGGWRNLSREEDIEFFVRMRPNFTAPVLTGFNLRMGEGARERRYAKGLGRWGRKFRSAVDNIRGQGMKVSDLRKAPWKSKLLYFTAYPFAVRRGIYRYSTSLDNTKLLEKLELDTMVDPKPLGVDDSWVIYPACWNDFPFVSRAFEPDQQILRKWGRFFKFSCVGTSELAACPSVFYLKDLVALKYANRISYLFDSEFRLMSSGSQ